MPRILKVTDPKKKVTDLILIKELAKQGIDKDEVEFVQDYGRRIKGVSSPYAKFYRHLNSNKRFAVISQLPMANADGVLILPAWEATEDGWQARLNLFSAKVDGTSINISLLSDQPDGRKKGDKLDFHPQVFVGDSEIQPVSLQPEWLEDDPLNVNYHQNVLEWDYGQVKRWLRIIEGRIHGYWLRPVNLTSPIRIKYNQMGDFRLRLGQFRINDDEELVPALLPDIITSVEYNGSQYYLISDSATFYPDANPETTSVDGTLQQSDGSGHTWSWCRDGTGLIANDSGLSIFGQVYSATTTNTWMTIGRSAILFDTSSLPDDCVISEAVLSLYGSNKQDPGGFGIDLNVYSSNPASNISLTATDFATFGTTAFSSAIAYNSWSISGYNDFSLNSSGLSAISKTGITKLGIREASHDAANSPPTWSSYSNSFLMAYSSDQGSGYKPKLVVTYIITPTVTTQAATNVNAISCTGNGNITATGGENCTRRGFCYMEGTSGDPTTANSVVYEDGSYGTGAFSKQITGLNPSSHYRVRAYAVNSAGTGYGSTVQVDTDAAGTPVVDIDAPTDVTDESLTANGEITDDGGGCTRRGFCYMEGTSGDPTTANSVVYEDGSFTTGVYDLSITGLSPCTAYRLRAYAVNSTGTVYSSTIQVYTTLSAPANLTATKGTYTDKVVLTWTKPSGTITGNKIYRDDVLIDTIGDVETYDDDGADAPTITPGAAVASDGAYSARVALSLSGASANQGTAHTYKVVAYNDAVDSPASNDDDGYRGVGTLTYQWQRSAADSDEDYSNLTGATSADYDDTTAPSDGTGCYYKCILNATGAAQQTSAADRGFRMHPLKPRHVWSVVIKNTSGETLSYLPQAYGIRTDYRINELPVLEFNVPGGCAARTYFIYPNEAWLYRDGVLKDIFYVVAPEKRREVSTKITVECMGMGVMLKKSAVASYSATATASAHLTSLLALQETAVITLGGVDATLDKSFALSVSKTNIWDACKEIQKIVGGYLYITFDPDTPSTRQLWLMGTMGEDKGQEIRLNKNLLNVRHRKDYIEHFNKLYCYGSSGLALTSKSYTHVSVEKSADETYGYLRLKEQYGAYSGWTGAGNNLPANVKVYKPGGSWVSPTSHNEEANWYYESYAYDGNNTSRTYYPPFTQYTYTSYLVLNRADTPSTQIKILLSDRPGHSMEVDIYYSGGWHNVYPLQVPGSDEIIISFSEQTITSVRIRFYNWYYPYPTLNTYVNEVYLWSTTGYADDTSNWKQGADEQTLRCAIASYDASAPYVISYTHAAYLIDPPADRTQIYSKTKDFETSNIDTLFAQGRVYLDGIKTAPVSLDVGLVDLSLEEGREFEELQLGSLVRVIDEDLDISEEARLVRIEHPELDTHPEKIKIEVSDKVKDIIDYLLE